MYVLNHPSKFACIANENWSFNRKQNNHHLKPLYQSKRKASLHTQSINFRSLSTGETDREAVKKETVICVILKISHVHLIDAVT